MVSLDDLKSAVFVIALIALLGGAVGLALGEFQDTQVTNTANCNSTVTTACGYAYNVTEDGLVGVDNTTGFMGTIGTILGVMALVGIVVASFRFSQR